LLVLILILKKTQQTLYQAVTTKQITNHMKTKLLFTFTFFLCSIYSYCQETKSISEQIKIERDTKLNKFTNEDIKSKKIIDSLQLKLKTTTGNKNRINGLETLQVETEKRLKKLEF